MITSVDRVRDQYQRWEARTATRFSGWSVRRRWTILVLIPTLIICCGGTAFGVPVAWVLRATLEASQGAPSLMRQQTSAYWRWPTTTKTGSCHCSTTTTRASC